MTDSHTAEEATVTFAGDRERSEFTRVEVLRGGFVRLSREASNRVEILPRRKIERIVFHE
ncbi:hypothetical protein Hmuk_2555 [Halomicrobium mukohataei DSM 12286]|uniref:Uncharacterized protein n=1 Tax=Halomicrobium mukohataei (strain ATCC 700874 / DSM 12286 / JCM 9738 / NCIMB 13541) TaxID=485914 RepID=C7NYX2_HALMD|nr:hypothetical protein Hmuk_2555 [Halomicrobium mukohataei DSM 12286]